AGRARRGGVDLGVGRGGGGGRLVADVVRDLVLVAVAVAARDGRVGAADERHRRVRAEAAADAAGERRRGAQHDARARVDARAGVAAVGEHERDTGGGVPGAARERDGLAGRAGRVGGEVLRAAGGGRARGVGVGAGGAGAGGRPAGWERRERVADAGLAVARAGG